MDEPTINLHCLRCGYNLQGTPEGNCPECGVPIDRTMLLETAHRSMVGRVLAALLLPGGVILALMVVVIVVGSAINQSDVAGAVLTIVALVGLLAVLIALIVGLVLAVQSAVALADARRVRGAEAASGFSRGAFMTLCCLGLIAAQLAVTVVAFFGGCACAITALSR